jgi:Leucine-rich repeat (LRR) protein
MLYSLTDTVALLKQEVIMNGLNDRWIKHSCAAALLLIAIGLPAAGRSEGVSEKTPGEWHPDRSKCIESGDTAISLDQLRTGGGQHLRRLYLRGRRLDANSEMLRDLPNLEELDISEAGIAEVPEVVFELSALRRLWLVRNPIRSLTPSISRLKRLNYVNLDGTEIGDLPDEFSRLAELRYLRVNETRISSLPESMRQLSNMRRLYARGTKLDAVPPVVASWRNVEDLAFDNTDISNIPDWLVNLPKLKRLSFSGCGKLGRLPDDLKGWRKLQVLDVSNTPISGDVGEMSRIRSELGDEVTILF